ncbi:CsbA family protein [Fredinandcohnia onubensis]|uniref:CsbA family protein n=1 Tax=Fredinandcohnia onubensis TaxID=1571209 RepID=UPI000C0BD5F9|nr:CsbA family protein [Fredinandcohnia onubensis]
MLLKILLALILPGVLVVFFTRVTYNHYVGFLLAVALIVASIYKGYADSAIIIVADILSLGVGFMYARNMGKRVGKKSPSSR